MKRNQWFNQIVVMAMLGMLVLSGSPAWSAMPQSVTSLTDKEKIDLVHMREEEKLARDVYQKMIDKWNLKIFVNIRESEQTHMDQIKILLDRYGVADPVSNNEVGSFSDPKLEGLYYQLVEQGEQSIADALNVGVFIEELDIDDLGVALNNTNHHDIRNVYTNLQEASRNHLESFESSIDLLTALP